MLPLPELDFALLPKVPAHQHTHRLKVEPNYFRAMMLKLKTFEVRYNDRGFAPLDTVLLEEYDLCTKTYTGHKIQARIRYILPLHKFIPGISHKWVVLDLDNLTRPQE